MERPIKCPFGTTYDASVYVDCPCPNCWADRSFARLASRTNPPDKPRLNSDRLRSLDAPPVATIRREYSTDLDRPARSTANDVWRSLTAAQIAASLLAALAVPSALLSWYSPVDPWGVFSVFSHPRKQDLLPGIYFGLVLCTGIYLWSSRNANHIAFAFFAVLLSWICAYQIAIEINLIIDAPLDSSAVSEIRSPQDFFKKFALGISGFAGGFAGSLGTAAGVSIVSPSVRNRSFFIKTTLIGLLAGGLLQVVSVSVLPLFIVWQPAIAACIAYNVVYSNASQHRKSNTYLPTRGAIVVIMTGTLVVGAVALSFKRQVEVAQAAQESSGNSPTVIEDDARKPEETFKVR